MSSTVLTLFAYAQMESSGAGVAHTSLTLRTTSGMYGGMVLVGRGAQGAGMDASTCGRRPRQQQREQSDWKVMGTLEKWTAKPVLKR